MIFKNNKLRRKHRKIVEKIKKMGYPMVHSGSRVYGKNYITPKSDWDYFVSIDNIDQVKFLEKLFKLKRNYEGEPYLGYISCYKETFGQKLNIIFCDKQHFLRKVFATRFCKAQESKIRIKRQACILFNAAENLLIKISYNPPKNLLNLLHSHKSITLTSKDIFYSKNRIKSPTTFFIEDLMNEDFSNQEG